MSRLSLHKNENELRFFFFADEDCVDDAVDAGSACYSCRAEGGFDFCAFCDDASAVVVYVGPVADDSHDGGFFGLACFGVGY